MSRQELADAVNRHLHQMEQEQAGKAGKRATRHPQNVVTANYVGKLERGVFRWPKREYRQAFRAVLDAPDDAALGFFIVRRRPRKVASPQLRQGEDAGSTSGHLAVWTGPRSRHGTRLASHVDLIATSSSLRTVSASASSAAHAEHALDGADWSAWFGTRVAHAVSMASGWAGEHTDVLQTLLHQEMLMFDACAPEGGRSHYEASRRQALITLATLPVTLGAPRTVPESNASVEVFLSHSGAGLAACWHLLRGSDLDAVDRLLAGYLCQLEAVARRPSKYQRIAARLASQGHRIAGIIALHRNHIRAREHHCTQAVEYAALAQDAPSRASALISLASTYFYESDPLRAADTYENALAFNADMSPLQRSRAHAERSVAHAQLGRERETLESIELAEQLYPDLPEQDPSHLYAEFTRASLTLEQGLAYAALAHHHPQRGYQHKAASIFAGIEQAAHTAVPDRIKYEIINHQAATAVLRGDLDAFGGYLARGVEGAVLLASKQRQKEVNTAWRLAQNTWPAEPKLNALGRDLMPALTAH